MPIYEKINFRWAEVMFFVAFCISLYSLFFFHENKIYLIGSDSYYYMSMSESIFESGELTDFTTIPSRPVKTTQNGVVIFHMLFTLMGLSKNVNLIVLSILYYLLKLSAVYPLIKIAKICGMKSKLDYYSLVAVFLGTWHLYRYSLLPNNDGMFNSLSVWMVYYIILLFFDANPKGLSHQIFTKERVHNILIIAIFSITLIHFRLQTILIIIPVVGVLLIKKQYDDGILMSLIILITLLSFYIFYGFIDMTIVKTSTAFNLDTWPSRIIGNIKWLYLTQIPNLIFTNAGYYGNMIYIPFFISLSVIFISGFKQTSNKGIFYISSICISTFIFSLLFERTRFMIFIFPYLYLLVLRWKPTRTIGYLFICVNLIASILNFKAGFWRGPGSKFWLHIYEEKISIADNNPILLSDKARHPYFFINSRSFRDELKWDLIAKNRSFFVIGDSAYINRSYSQFQEMASINGYDLESNPLTPDLEEFDGWSLVNFSLDKIAK